MANENDKNKFEPKILSSLDELDFDGPVLENPDFEEDAWSYGAPPPAEVYKFKWFLDKDGLQSCREKADDPKSAYLRINILGKLIENEEWDGATVYHTLDSRVFRGKSISTMVGFLIKAGAKKHLEGKQLTARYVAGLVLKVLAKEPTVRAELDWKGSYKHTPTSGKNKGNEVWENKFNHYNEFPDDLENKGKKLSVVTVTGVDGQPHEIRAMTKIVRFLSKDEVAATKKTVQPITGGMVQPLSIGDVELEDSSPAPAPAPVSKATPPVKGVVAPPSAPPVTADDDLDLLDE